MAELLALLIDYYGKRTPLRQLACIREDGDSHLMVALYDPATTPTVRATVERAGWTVTRATRERLRLKKRQP